MADLARHTGGCHCGKVRYEVSLELAGVVACNCSICTKRGWLLAFVPADGFRLLSEERDLADYQFGKQNIHHLFCRVCGVASFGRGIGRGGQEMVSINVRCLDDVDLEALPVTRFDGRRL